MSIAALKAVHERTHPGAGNRPPRAPWPPQQPAQQPTDGTGGAVGEGWDEQVEKLLAEFDSDDETDDPNA